MWAVTIAGRGLNAPSTAIAAAAIRLWNAIGHIIDCFTQTECKNYFTAAGYAAT